MKKIYIVLFISIIFLSGCSVKENFNPNASISKADIKEDSEILNEYYELKSSDISSHEIGNFISQHIENLHSSKASILVADIIKSSTLEKPTLSSEIYSYPNFNEIYASNFNYVWNIENIKNIEDEGIRIFLSKIASSYYKVETHKNYLDVDLDYNRLSKLDNLSDELKRYIQININKREILLSSSAKGELDYKSLRDNIILLEEFFVDYPESEISFEAEALYKNLLTMFFIGSDGLDPFDYDKKNFKDSFFNVLVDTSINFSSTMIADLSNKFLNELDYKNEYKNIDYVSLISNFRKMGLQNANSIRSITSEKTDNSNIIYPSFENFKDKKVEEKINNTIVSALNSMKAELKWKSDPNTKYNISYFINYGSYKYISLQLTGSSYNRENKENFTVQKNLNFALDRGQEISLSDLLGIEFSQYKDELSQLIIKHSDIPFKTLSSCEGLTSEPDFMISNLSLVLYFKPGQYNFDEEYPVYVYLNQSIMDDLLDFRNIYK